MAYSGFLVKVGKYEIPAERFIKSQSYKATLTVQELDSYRDANGVMHRDVMEHRVNKVEFETPAMLTNEDVTELFGKIQENYTVSAERRFTGTIYVPELDEYFSQDMYMSDPVFTIHGIFDGVIKYSSVHITFVAY